MNKRDVLSGQYCIPKSTFTALLAAVALTSINAAFAADITINGFAKDERFDGAEHTRAEVEDPAFNGTPDALFYLPSFEAPVNQLKNGADFQFVQRVSAIFTPAVSGNYVFFISADDDADLFLSTDATPANKKLIAQETAWSNNREWVSSGGSSDLSAKRSDQFSGNEWPGGVIALKAGTSYYIEGVEHEGGGGDDFSATFKLDTEEDPQSGDATRLRGSLIKTSGADPGITINITTQPANLTVQDQLTGTFSVVATGTQAGGGTPTLFYQWQKQAPGATGFTDIPGADLPTYGTPAQSLTDTGTQYRVIVTAPGVSVTSNPATLTVVADNTPPKVVSVGSLQNSTNSNMEVDVIFDEPLKDAASATTLTNYTLSAGTITAARYVTNSSGNNVAFNTAGRQSGVVLTATGITPGTSYSLTVNGLSDANGNAMTSPQTVPFTASPYKWISIGRTTELIPPSMPDALAVGTNGFNLVSGGNAFWGTSDDITMVYQEVTGDFDKMAQVEYSDPASHWARSGISARESLNNGAPTTDDAGANPASRYQMVISDPTFQTDSPGNAGTAANNQYETNRRLQTGGATTSSNGGGNPNYPNSYVRLKRIGQVFSMFYSSNAVHWVPLGNTDFADPTLNANNEAPLPDKMFVGPTYGPENGNLGDDTTGLPFRQSQWATRIRNYSDVPGKARGQETYAIGLNFGADEAGGVLSTNDVAGADVVAQKFWNNLKGMNSTDSGPVTLVADNNGTPQATTATVEWDSPNTWSSTGPRGEENNMLTGTDAILLTGYLDSGAASTTHATISNIPTQLTSAGYDVYVYFLGGVGNKGGGYRILDASGTVLKDFFVANGAVNPTNLFQAPTNAPAGGTNVTGNYIVFKGLKAPAITVEASTENGLGFGNNPRVPLNAIQLVVPPAGGGGGNNPTLSFTRTATGLTITFTGTLQKSTKVDSGWTDAGTTSPQNFPFTEAAAMFFRAKQ
jgi:hypothetical protein